MALSEPACSPDGKNPPKRQRGDEAPTSDSDDVSSAEAGLPLSRPALVPFSFAELEAEVEALRADPPPYVSDIGHLRVPSVECDSGGKVVKPTGEGPWNLTLRVAGPEGDDAYGFPFKVCLHFDSDLWPAKLAIVRFQCVFHHALTDDGGGMMVPFYKALPRDERGACTLKLMVQAVRTFLEDPLKAWKLPTEYNNARVRTIIDAHRKQNAQRFDVIKKYSALRKHADLFPSIPSWREEWLDPEFCRAQQENTPEAWRAILREELSGEVFSFRIFTDAFCEHLVEEIFSFYASGLPARRPNSMNNYGIILNEIGLEHMIDELQRMLQPIGDLLWPGPGNEWDGHHCFIVRYRAGEDLGLDMHTDDSDVTFNICLGLDFTAAGLQFCGLMGAPNHRKHTYTYMHSKGRCVCHLGRKRHGADDIASGERLNLILWNHSSTYRQSDEYTEPPYEKEEGPPDELCVSYTHDRDYGNFKAYPANKEQFKGRGWCPRPRFEYDGFKADSEKEIMGS